MKLLTIIACFACAAFGYWLGVVRKDTPEPTRYSYSDTDVVLVCGNYLTETSNPNGTVALLCEFEKKGVL